MSGLQCLSQRQRLSIGEELRVPALLALLEASASVSHSEHCQCLQLEAVPIVWERKVSAQGHTAMLGRGQHMGYSILAPKICPLGPSGLCMQPGGEARVTLQISTGRRASSFWL